MKNQRGKIIVIDGIDGAGKSVQSELVVKRLNDMGIKAVYRHFPNYDSPTGQVISKYLYGWLGYDTTKLNPYMCCLFYAIDRATTAITDLNELLDSGVYIVCDRYISANVIHQVSKQSTDREKIDMLHWLYDTEKLIGVPIESATIYLNMPIELSQQLLSKRYGNDESKKDIHESNIAYLENCSKMVEVVSKELEKSNHPWHIVSCATLNDGKYNLRSIEDISNEIWNTLKHLKVFNT